MDIPVWCEGDHGAAQVQPLQPALDIPLLGSVAEYCLRLVLVDLRPEYLPWEQGHWSLIR